MLEGEAPRSIINVNWYHTKDDKVITLLAILPLL